MALHSFHCPPEIWQPAMVRARAERIPLTAVIVAALRDYASGAPLSLIPPPDPEPAPRGPAPYIPPSPYSLTERGRDYAAAQEPAAPRGDVRRVGLPHEIDSDDYCRWCNTHADALTGPVCPGPS